MLLEGTISPFCQTHQLLNSIWAEWMKIQLCQSVWPPRTGSTAHARCDVCIHPGVWETSTELKIGLISSLTPALVSRCRLKREKGMSLIYSALIISSGTLFCPPRKAYKEVRKWVSCGWGVECGTIQKASTNDDCTIALKRGERVTPWMIY